MARIGGVNIPDNKRVEISLTYIYGIGKSRSQEICNECGIDLNKRVSELNENELALIRQYIEKSYKTEGDLRREVAMSIKRLIDIKCYRGRRHIAKLPVRGQRSKTNARTRKGKKKTIANKKK